MNKWMDTVYRREFPQMMHSVTFKGNNIFLSFFRGIIIKKLLDAVGW